MIRVMLCYQRTNTFVWPATAANFARSSCLRIVIHDIWKNEEEKNNADVAFHLLWAVHRRCAQTGRLSINKI